MSIDVNEPEPADDVPEWKGVSMDEVHKGFGAFDRRELPPICPSASHIVLVSVGTRSTRSIPVTAFGF